MYRPVGLAGMNFQKKSVIRQKIEKLEKGLKQLSDPPKRIVVEIVSGSDRHKGPPGRFSSHFAILAGVLPF